MLEQRDIIVFGDDWERHPNTLAHLTVLLARDNRIIWVNSLGHRTPRLGLKDLVRAVEKVKVALGPKKHAGAPVRVVRPLTIPYHGFAAIRKLNASLLTLLLRKLMKSLRIERPMIFSNSPVMHEIIGKLHESVVVYYCLDDYTGFAGTTGEMAAIEEEMLRKSDVAFFISERLLAGKRCKPKHSYLISQGVDAAHFQSETLLVPEIMRAIPRPILGYMGLVEAENWVDMRLIASVAAMHPEWTIVMVGPVTSDLGACKGMRNIRFVGKVPYRDLPAYARQFDAGLIPFHVNPVTLACNPLKLLEYFAMGIPVVSTPLPAVMKFEPLVQIARDADGFSRELDKALRHDPAEACRNRREVSETHSWKSVLDAQCSLILSAEAQKAQGNPRPAPLPRSHRVR